MARLLMNFGETILLRLVKKTLMHVGPRSVVNSTMDTKFMLMLTNRASSSFFFTRHLQTYMTLRFSRMYWVTKTQVWNSWPIQLIAVRNTWILSKVSAWSLLSAKKEQQKRLLQKSRSRIIERNRSDVAVLSTSLDSSRTLWVAHS